MRINTSGLAKIMEILQLKIHEAFPDEFIEVSNDFYWEIFQEDLYESSQQPQTLGLGQLSDDWQELRGLLDPQRDTTSYDLKRMAAILEVLGWELNRSPNPNVQDGQVVRIAADALFRAIQRLMAELCHYFPFEIAIDSKDFYWKISPYDLYDPLKDPKDWATGRFSEDWDTLLELTTGKRMPNADDFVRAASILQRLSSHVVW